MVQALLALAVLSLVPSILAYPSLVDQVVLGNGGYHQATAVTYLDLKENAEIVRWHHEGKEQIKQNGLLYELVSRPSLTQNHQLRIKSPDLCDPNVLQYSGYLDIVPSKHLFFWFFQARNSPSTAPLILWLNGGPGCSSSIGLFFELGPCTITDQGHNTTINPYSWNENANIIFLDQPVNVGFSYAEGGNGVTNSTAAGHDLWAFLQLFFHRFPEYSNLPFHLAGESYAGTYLPHFAKVIHDNNKHIRESTRINLASLILANGLTNPKIQFGAVAEYACGKGPYPVFSDSDYDRRCSKLRNNTPQCESRIEECYRLSEKDVCAGAFDYCLTNIWGPIMDTGLNPYDIRKPCSSSLDGGDDDDMLCYPQIPWIETYLNHPSHKSALGVDPERTFEICNDTINDAFTFGGEPARNSAPLLTELVDEGGVKLLVYAGDADMTANYIGEERWLEHLNTTFQQDFRTAKTLPWYESNSGRQAGTVRATSGTGNVTFVRIFEAGHMAPYDQPAAALDLITRWIRNESLSSKSFTVT